MVRQASSHLHFARLLAEPPGERICHHEPLLPAGTASSTALACGQAGDATLVKPFRWHFASSRELFESDGARNESRGFAGLELRGPKDHFRVTQEVKAALAGDDKQKSELVSEEETDVEEAS